MQNVIIFDIDGVLCDSSERERKTLDKFNVDNLSLEHLHEYHSMPYDEDMVIENGLFLYLAFKNVYKILFLTARNSEWSRKKTLEWLQTNIDNEIEESQLYMSPAPVLIDNIYYRKDGLNSVECKRLNVNQIKSKYNIVMAIDDFSENHKMLVEEGVTALLFTDSSVKGLQKWVY